MSQPAAKPWLGGRSTDEPPSDLRNFVVKGTPDVVGDLDHALGDGPPLDPRAARCRLPHLLRNLLSGISASLVASISASLVASISDNFVANFVANIFANGR